MVTWVKADFLLRLFQRLQSKTSSLSRLGLILDLYFKLKSIRNISNMKSLGIWWIDNVAVSINVLVPSKRKTSILTVIVVVYGCLKLWYRLWSMTLLP